MCCFIKKGQQSPWLLRKKWFWDRQLHLRKLPAVQNLSTTHPPCCPSPALHYPKEAAFLQANQFWISYLIGHLPLFSFRLFLMVIVKPPGFASFEVSKKFLPLPHKIALQMENRRVLLGFHYSTIFCKWQFLWWMSDTAPVHLYNDFIVCNGFHFLWVTINVCSL